MKWSCIVSIAVLMCSLCVGAVSCAPMPLRGTDRPLSERFADPPAESRIIKIIHNWPDDDKAQDDLIQGLLSKGFGGVVSNHHFHGYMVDEKRWISFVRAIKTAKEAGMSLWLYDEQGYPSGNAGGLVLEGHPELEARGLLILTTKVAEGSFHADIPPGEIRIARAFRLGRNGIGKPGAVDLAPSISDGKLDWEAPSGDWQVMVVTEDRLYEGTHASGNVFKHQPYINLLLPEATERYLQVNHDTYTRDLGDDLSKYFVSTFTDEPSLMSFFLREMPYSVLPWGYNLPVEFKKRRGYALEPVLPEIIAEAGAHGRKARYDFWLTVGELVSENYFGQIQDWCRAHRIPSGGHLLHEEMIRKHVPLYGDFYKCMRRLDAPGIDMLNSIPERVRWRIARLAGSVADIEGRTITMSETSEYDQIARPEGDTRPIIPVTEDQIRGTCNRLIINGINTITSYYSWRDLTDEQINRLNTWIGRCCTMLKGGKQVADVALVYPVQSIWPHYEPSRNDDSPDPTVNKIEKYYALTQDQLWENRWNYTILDAQAICDSKVRGGLMSVSGMSWRVVVLPWCDTLPIAAWKKLYEFWKGGGVVIAVGVLPANSESEFPSAVVSRLAREMFGSSPEPAFVTNPAGGVGTLLPDGSSWKLREVLPALLGRDVSVDDASPTCPIRTCHRLIDGRHVYFLINDSPQSWKGKVSLSVRGPGEAWDPATGKSTRLERGKDIPLELGPYGGMFYRFKTAVTPRRRTSPPGPIAL